MNDDDDWHYIVAVCDMCTGDDGRALRRRESCQDCVDDLVAKHAVEHPSHTLSVSNALDPALFESDAVQTVVNTFEVFGPPNHVPRRIRRRTGW